MGLTFWVSWLRQALDVKSSGDVVLYGGPVAPHYRTNGLSETSQVIEDLQGRADLGRVLIHKETERRSLQSVLMTVPKMKSLKRVC